MAGTADSIRTAGIAAQVKGMAAVRRGEALLATLFRAFHVLVHKVYRLEDLAVDWSKVTQLFGFCKQKKKKN